MEIKTINKIFRNLAQLLGTAVIIVSLIRKDAASLNYIAAMITAVFLYVTNIEE